MTDGFLPNKPQDKLATTVEMAEDALAQLKTGKIDQKWKLAAHALTLCSGEPHAVIEGTLLMVAADLLTIGKSEEITKVNNAANRVNPYLTFAEVNIAHAGLRPIGQAILEQCKVVAPTQEYRDRLAQLAGPSDPI